LYYTCAEHNPDNPYTCASHKTCLWNSHLKVVGCGNPTSIHYITSCVPYRALQECYADCLANPAQYDGKKPLSRYFLPFPFESRIINSSQRIGPPPLRNAPCRARSKLFNPPLPINIPRRALPRPHDLPRSNHHRTLTALVRRRREYHLRYPGPAYHGQDY
jgi:hypothetical protein